MNTYGELPRYRGYVIPQPKGEIIDPHSINFFKADDERLSRLAAYKRQYRLANLEYVIRQKELSNSLKRRYRESPLYRALENEAHNERRRKNTLI